MDAFDRFPFYLLPPKKQEMYALILSTVQIGAKIRMGPLKELNYKTATDVRFIFAWIYCHLKYINQLFKCSIGDCSSRKSIILMWR